MTQLDHNVDTSNTLKLSDEILNPSTPNERIETIEVIKPVVKTQLQNLIDNASKFNKSLEREVKLELTKLERIKFILKSKGMDSQQVEQATEMIREVLGFI